MDMATAPVKCTTCGGSNTTHLDKPIVEVFYNPMAKTHPGYERYKAAPYINREWTIYTDGKEKKIWAELKAAVFTDLCGDCNAVFPYPSIKMATKEHFLDHFETRREHDNA